MDTALHKASEYAKAKAKFYDGAKAFQRPELIPYTTPPDIRAALERASLINRIPSRHT